MAKGFSAAQIKGTLGRDPEVKSTPNGTRVANFSVAVERGYGEKVSTDWHNVVAWKDLADFCEKYLKKGKSVYVTGELQVRSWDDKTSGQKRYITEIKADRIEFADSGESKPGGQQRQSTAQPRQQAAPQARATSQADDAFDDGSEIPF
jgi:single-strand DNA-binding protein